MIKELVYNIKNLLKLKETESFKYNISFYSESKNDWLHLKNFIIKLSENPKYNICYISSDKKDEGLNNKYKFKSFLIDNKYLLEWLFKNIKTDIFFTSLPDLNIYHLKKSIHNVHYVYIHHSLVSMHSAYRSKAFNNFDAIFCAGPHHKYEMKEIIKFYNLKNIKLIEYGYGKIDLFLDLLKNIKKNNYKNSKKNLLIAPSWGKNCIIENGYIYKIVDHFLGNGFKINLKPHHETIRKNFDLINNIKSKYKNNINIITDSNNLDIYIDSNLMLSDWSGAAFEYIFCFNKPVIFVDKYDLKINNEDFSKINLEVFEDYIRSKIGIIYNEKIDYSEYNLIRNNNIKVSDYVYNFHCSHKVGISYVENFFKNK